MSTLNTVCQSPRGAVLSSAADADEVLMNWNKKTKQKQVIKIMKYYLTGAKQVKLNFCDMLYILPYKCSIWAVKSSKLSL